MKASNKQAVIIGIVVVALIPILLRIFLTLEHWYNWGL
jgi:hypothetical protein